MIDYREIQITRTKVRPLHRLFGLSLKVRFCSAALVATLMLVCAGIAGATTYYVSNSGSDSNSGTSTSSPWKTAAKVNGFTFNPGDIIEFQCGGTWDEALNPQGGSGAAGNPIIFQSYGSGSAPLFFGGQTLPNSGFTLVSGTVWQISVATQINEVYINKVAMIPANPNANQPVSSIPNSWYWSGGVLQINVSTNPNTDGNLYEGAVREDLISNGNPVTTTFFNHLVFSNLSEEESGDLNAGYGVRIQNGTDITLNSIVSSLCGKHNFGVINSTQVTVNNCQASYPMPGQQPEGGYSAYVSYGDNSTGLSNQTSVYNNCTGDHMEDTTPNQQYEDTGYEFFTCHGSNLGAVTLNNCDAYSSSGHGAGAHWTINNSESGAAIAIHGGYQYNNQLEMTGSNLLVDGLTMQGPGGTSTNDATSTIDMECSSSTVQNIVMENLNIGYWLYQAAIQDNGNNNTIRFNTIVNDPSSGDTSILNQNTTEILEGNILVTTGSGIGGKAPATNAYNLIYTSASSAGFVNASADNFALTSSSPARDYVPTSVPYPATDHVGTARPDGSANDAGAYSYSGTVSPPAITSSTTATGTVGTAFSYQITATNSPTSYGESGTLPAGLSFSTTTGKITGTPTAAGAKSVTISATNSAGTGSEGLTITISNPAAPTITSAGTASGTVGTAFSYQITASGSPTSYGASSLPAGVTVNTSTGLVSGTPTTATTYTSTVTATNAGGTGSKTVTITINPASAAAYNVYALWTPGTTITNGGADSYGNGYNSSLVGSSVVYDGNTTTFGPANAADAYSNETVTLPTGSYTQLNMIGTAVGGIVTNQTFTVTYTDNSTQTFTQNLSDWGNPQSFPNETIVSSESTSLQQNGTSKAFATYIYGYTFTLNGKTAKSITLPATRQVIAFGFTTGSGSAPSKPVITSATTKSGTVGTSFSYQITASNSPTSYSESGTLPAGLTFTSSTGVISGTPTTPGVTSVTIGATNAGGTGTATLTITISSPPTAYNVYALWTPGTTITNGGADSYGHGYNANLVGTSVTYTGTSYTLGPVNAADAWSNTTVNLPPGNYTALKMIGTAVGGIVTGEVFTVNYTDGTTQTFTQNLSDWENPQGFSNETTVSTQASSLNTNGTTQNVATYIYGYTFNLNGKSVKSMTLPATRQVVAFGFSH